MMQRTNAGLNVHCVHWCLSEYQDRTVSWTSIHAVHMNQLSMTNKALMISKNTFRKTLRFHAPSLLKYFGGIPIATCNPQCVYVYFLPGAMRPRNPLCFLLFGLVSIIYFQSGMAKQRTSSSKRPLRHSGRLLGRPNPIKCARRPRTVLDKGSGHYYFFSDDTRYRVRCYNVVI